MKHLKLLLFLMLPAAPLFAQYSARNNDTKLEADYYLMSGDYQRALKLYLNVLKSEPGNADMKYKAGICYLNSENEKATAIEYLEEAVQNVSKKYNANSFKEMNAPIEAHFLLGSAYRVADRLDEAISSYNNYKNLLEPRDEYNHAIVDQYIKSSVNAKEMQQNPVNLAFTNLGGLVNTTVSNFNPVISGDGKILAYTAIGTRGFEIYSSGMTEEGAWGKPVNITTMLGSAGRYLKTTGMTYDGAQIFFVYSDPFDSEIYTSKYSRNRWSRAEKLDKPINGKSNEIHCSISADGRTLYFVSDRPGGEGDFDIYKSALNSKGEWSKPVNLGPSVNTLFKEDTPFVSPDGKYLYFSSEGHTGMGGLDVFRIDLSDPGSEPVNLGYPINNTDNNTFFFPYGETNTGYYAANNKDSYGSADIYLVNLLPGDLPLYAGKESITDSSSANPPADTSIFIFTPVQEDYTLAEAEVLVYDESTGVMLSAVEPFRYDKPGSAPVISPASSAAPSEPVQPDIAEAMADPEFEPLRETDSEPVSEMPLPRAAETSAVAESASVPVPAGITPDKADKPAGINEDAPVSALPEAYSPTATAYTIQIGAGKKPLDMKAFNELDTVMVTFGKDEWYRYTCGMARDIQGAELLKDKMIARGYKDAFIVIKPVISQYTIQVMAVPGPIVSASNFQGLPYVMVVKGQDMYLRYSTGEFASVEEASAALDKIRGMGFRDAFVRKAW